MKKFMVIEDNGGGLTLVVFSENGADIEYIHGGYEYYPGLLAEDLERLKDGDNPAEDWDGNYLDDEEMTAHMENPKDLESWFPWERMSNHPGWNIVVDNDDIYPAVMGEAAQIEFGRRTA